MVLEQINTDHDKESISANELRDAVKPGWFLDSENSDYDENIRSVWDLLNSIEQLTDEDKALMESLRSTLNIEKETIKNWNIVTDEDKKLLNVRIDLLWENSQEVYELQELIALYDNINEENIDVNQQDEIIITKFENLPEQDKNMLLNKLNIWLNLLNDIDLFLDEGNVELSNVNTIKAVNILNDIIKEDPERHHKLENIVNTEAIEMSHAVNIKIANNEKGNADYYSDQQKMLIQLRANVCHWEDLYIDWRRWNYLFSFAGKDDNQKLTTIYIYRLELITRQDVIDYRNNNATNNLLYIPELDEMLSVLPCEDQNKILEDFLGDCFFNVRQTWMIFENNIWSENFRELLDLAIKSQTQKDVPIEQWIQDRQSLLNFLSPGKDDRIIKNIQDEIAILSTKDPVSWEYLFKTMGDYYKYQFDHFKDDINRQNERDVDMAYRQHANEEITYIMDLFNELWENIDKGKLIDIIDRLAAMYNDGNTNKYKNWMENWELFDSYFIKNIAVKFNKYLNSNEQNKWWQDFFNFMNKCREEISEDFNKCSNTLDIVHQIELVEQDGNTYKLEPTFWRPWEFVDNTMIATNWYGHDCLPPNMQNIDSFSTPVSYKLQLWTSIFEWWSWVKTVFDQVQSWEINVVITDSWYPWRRVEAGTTPNLSTQITRKYLMTDMGFEMVDAVYQPWFWWKLCRYEKRGSEIWLREFDENGNLPTEPTKKITWQDISQSNLAVSSALENIDTEEFNDVWKEFDENPWSFAELQHSIESFMDKYDNQDLTDIDEQTLKEDVATMAGHIAKLNKDIDKFHRLRDILSKMVWNWNRIKNNYEEYIELRISQLDTLISICEKPHYTEYLSRLMNVSSNDSFFERVDVVKLLEICWAILSFVAWVALAPLTWWLSLICGIAISATIATKTYMAQQRYLTRRNFSNASVKVVKDRYWNDIEIPGYIEEKDQTSLFKFYEGEISFWQLLSNIASDLWPDLLRDAALSILWAWIWKALKLVVGTDSSLVKLYNTASDAYWNIVETKNFWLLVYSLVATSMITESIFDRWMNPDTTQESVSQEIAGYISTLMPKNLGWNWNESLLNDILWKLTCKAISNNGLEMEYDPDDPNFLSLLHWYREDGATVQEDWDWTIRIMAEWKKTITYIPSRVPISYRQLPQAIKDAISCIWCVNVDHDTWGITYAAQDWLRSLWAYLENLWQWEVLISPEWYAKIIFEQPNWQRSVVTIQPEVV